MIAADTSSLVEFFIGGSGSDVENIANAMKARILFLPPPVLTEMLSDPKLSQELDGILRQFPLLETLPGFWERAGRTRSVVLRKKNRARLGDALIAQYCLDHDIGLITRNADFTVFEKMTSLKIVA